MIFRQRSLNLPELLVVIAIVAVALTLVVGADRWLRGSRSPVSLDHVQPAARSAIPSKGLADGYERRVRVVDSSGLGVLIPMLPRWKPEASLREISDIWSGAGYRAIEQVEDVNGDGRLYHNNRQGEFTEDTLCIGIDGPHHGFSCWTWDFDNDGWLDIFATCYDRTVAAVASGLLGQPHNMYTSRLYRDQEGKGFVDVAAEAGLDIVFATMGNNYADFDNDGFLDMYLGTGDPSLAALVPNRMFKNVAGKRFAEITASSGTGHLQKGHGVACGDWDRDGDVDLFVQTGGVANGDKYHNVLFQNPGQGNHSLTVKLVGKKTNRAALGARIKVVTAGDNPLTVHRHVSSGSSFGANPLEQTIGLARATRVDRLEIHWPTSGTTQVFRDLAADQAVEVTEFADSYRRLNWKPIPQPDQRNLR